MTHYARNEDDVEPVALRRTMEKITAALGYDRSAAVVESPPAGGVVRVSAIVSLESLMYAEFCLPADNAIGGQKHSARRA